MHPLAPHYERKTRSDHGKKRTRDSNASSSSTTLNHPSSSRSLDDIVDENDEESFHSNSLSPSQNISSLSNLVSRVRQNPPHESPHLNTYLFETINLQAQQQDALKDMISTHINVTTPGFPECCLHATPPPDTRLGLDRLSTIPKHQEQYAATVPQLGPGIILGARLTRLSFLQ
ncbi:hypothetical protein Tco_0382971, partial [Tanacetum coccineum]